MAAVAVIAREENEEDGTVTYQAYDAAAPIDVED